MWVEVLSTKGVHELVKLNLMWPMEMEFYLHRLRSRNQITLVLGFFALD